jgi:hypothetical protein
VGFVPHRFSQALAAGICLCFGPAHAADPTGPTFLAVPQVTVEMEKAFLTKYLAVVKKQDIDAYLKLIAAEPSSDSASNSNMKDLLRFSMAMESTPGASYSFTPIKPGEHDQPSQMNGKTYDDYLPAVIALSINFPPPAHPSADEGVLTSVRHLLGIQNGQLFLVGSKEDDHAVIPPPPAPMPAPPNYQLKPNLRHLTNQQQQEQDENGTSFASLDEFLASVKQPSLELLASGKTNFEYCSIYRLNPNLLVCASASRHGDSNFGFQFRAQNAMGADLVCEHRWINLVDHQVDNGPASDVTGYVFDVPPDYRGPIAVKLQEQDDAGKDGGSYSHTVDWK